MRKLILILFVAALMVGCSEEAEEMIDITSDVADVAMDKGDGNDSYAKKYGAAMKKAMAKSEE